MSNRQTAQATTSAPALQMSGVLQRKCASCGQHTIGGGGCSDYEKKKGSLQRSASSSEAVNEVPPIVHEVLRSSGQPLDPATRAFMEPRFSHDFSRVRVHTDGRAAESARAVNALAYTVGRDIVFGAHFAQETVAGRALMAHELTHVIQQSRTSTGFQTFALDVEPTMSAYEREADEVGRRVAAGASAQVSEETTVPAIQRQVITKEAAGGCGVCYGPQVSGMIAHDLIQAQFKMLYPGAAKELPFFNPRTGSGRIDLALPTAKGLEIGEIKPANPNGYAQGLSDMAFYKAALKLVLPKATVLPLTKTIASQMPFPNPSVPTCPLQMLSVNPPVEGVYGYYCLPPYSNLISNPFCQCEGGQKKKVPIPRSVLEDIEEFIRRVVDTGEDAEVAARKFLNAHPEVRTFLITAGVAIILATIVEDIVTLGVGLIDDPASIAAALALIKVAQ